MSTAVKWEPACLTFPIALSKSAVQQLRASNSSATDTYSFKVKTTNPRRYSVRPNVGLIYPGQEATVTVQLPAMKELPADMNKCKDKFQVLTLKLEPAHADELKALSAEGQRSALTALWAADASKDATVDKIKCAFAFDSSYRDVPIPEEEPNIAPYSPETVPVGGGVSGGGGAPATPGPPPQTPYAEPVDEVDAEVEAAVNGSKGDEPASPSTAAPSTPQRGSTGGGGGAAAAAAEAAALKAQLEADVATAAQQRELATAATQHLEAELAKQRKLTAEVEKQAKAAKASAAAAAKSSNKAAPQNAEPPAQAAGGGGGYSGLTVLLFVVATA